MSSIDLKSSKTRDNEYSNQVDLNSFSQSVNNLDRETSFNEPNGPSILLKSNISHKTMNYDLQKSKSAPYLVDPRPVDSTDAKLYSGHFRTNHLTSSPNLFKNASNLLLTSTPNLFNNLNNSKLLETPTLKKLLPSCNGDTPNLSANFPPAIQVKNVSFDYCDRKAHASNILRNVNLTCSIGSIYGLLGPSGCGKTTLIKLILSKFRPISGEIRAFGLDVRSKYSGVVGSGVGYMPQELALIFHFTIEEQLNYFGRLYYMPYDKIRKQINYLCRILDLPEKTRLIHQLSGGQQHRVSFSCALIHNPRLLILDEPTVGLDPVLRERTWLQLMSLAKNFKTSILITTHYIEEANRANMIGFMRNGQLLVEQTPKYLMKKYATNSLENIFLTLCIEQTKIKKTKNSLQTDVNFNNSLNEIIEKSHSRIDQQTPSTSSSSSPDLNELKLNNDYKNEYNLTNSSDNASENLFTIPWKDRYDRSATSKWFIQFFAIIIKYFILTKRRPETVLAQYVLPIIAIAVFCVCIGSTPSGIKIGVINEEECGFPFDMTQNFTQPILENSIEEFINRFETFIGLKNEDDGGKMVNDEDHIKLRKRSIDELTTSKLNIFNEEEATTIYPSKFNLMNNLNFNENKHGSADELIAPGEPVSIDKLNSERPVTLESVTAKSGNSSTIEQHNLSNHKMISNTTISSTSTSTFISSSTSTSKPDYDQLASSKIPLINSVDESNAPLLMPVISNDNTSNEEESKNESRDDDENYSSSTEGTNEENSPTMSEEEEDAMLDAEINSHQINTQFEDACFSQDLIRMMNSFIFTKIPYDSHQKAIQDIKSGKIWGVIRIKKGFSRALVSKILFQDYGNVNINDSLVEINADLTNNALTITLDVTMTRLYPQFIRDVLAKANQINLKSNSINHTDYKFYNLNSGRLPIVLGSHVFKAKFTLKDYFGIREFAAPGLLIILTYSISYALTVFSLVTEIHDKMFDRHQCIGLTSNQLIFSHLLTRFIFSATGTILVVLMSIYFFDISNHGSFLSAITLLLLQSYCAMTHGMLISVLCPSLFICAAVSNGYLFFVFIMSGVLWSFETLPPVMKQIGIVLPSTIPCESLRTIMTRGQGFESNTVFYGYLITIAWILIHYFATIIVFNYRKISK